ncbi:hypothetical protein [Haloarcula sp. Atlit-7R]|uniref:hypothetical protein n=1 Tax=Haloarcula sp. Atlit-7R TaxID=2282125 RepID=UPI0011C390CC|nr:hypothetical protein [Haloarcula sp. Atlit-7R]
MGSDPPDVKYDSDAGVYWTEIDPSETQPTIAILCLFDKFETFEDVDIVQLYDLVDPDALSTLLVSHGRKALAETLKLEYTAENSHLLIYCKDGTVDIRLRIADTPTDPDYSL